MEGLEIIKDYLVVWGFRLVNKGDLMPGKEMWMIILSHYDGLNLTQSPEVLGTKIRLDSPAVCRGSTVYYHCIYPKWDQQCFVPIQDFLDGEDVAYAVRR